MDTNFSLKTKDGQPFEVTEKGSLGLLALGYVGLMLWREKRQQHQNSAEANNNHRETPS